MSLEAAPVWKWNLNLNIWCKFQQENKNSVAYSDNRQDKLSFMTTNFTSEQCRFKMQELLQKQSHGKLYNCMQNWPKLNYFSIYELLYIYIYIYIYTVYIYIQYIEVHLNKLECREKSSFFLVSYFKKWNFHKF